MGKKKMTSNDSKEEVIPIIEIDKLIHEPARLMIISLLYVVESADFLWIKRQTDLTDGNLSSHLSKLESAGYVTVEKSIKNKKTNTSIKLSGGYLTVNYVIFFSICKDAITQICCKT